jgi:hypothetical protein
MLYGGDEREAKPYVIQTTSPYTSHDESSNTNSRRLSIKHCPECSNRQHICSGRTVLEWVRHTNIVKSNCIDVRSVLLGSITCHA